MTLVGWKRLIQLVPLFLTAEEHHAPLALPSSFWTANPTAASGNKIPAHSSADQHRIWKEEDRARSTVGPSAKRVEKIYPAGTGHPDNCFPVAGLSHISL